ncbi:zinc finger protein 462-like [Parambassis ranga]|uniref:Zinc finger protein 462-like n=1 Tax=Parambassis ranga TaxID=210632 RepID=A0A6P7J101_9TELE|nr:zinc finger protein 462-like [Parambassis ranga]
MRGSELREEYKMQNDSLQLSTSDHVKHVNNGAVSQESFQCGHCVLIFKTKVYLFEHLNKVHGFDVDAARKDAGLNSSETNKTNTDNSSVVSGDHFKCQHCGFIACSGDVLNEHVNQCLGTPNVFQNADPKSLANQHDEAAAAEEIPSVLSNTSTSKTKHAPCSSKDLKTYRRPSKPTTKYISTSVSNEEAPEMSADGTKGTLILQDSPSCSSPNSSGVFKVTAKSLIDIDISSDNKFYRCSQTENFFTADMKPPKLREHFKETGLDNAPKRTKKVNSHPAKKAKLHSEDIKLPDKEKTSKKIAFEFSEDEEERKIVLVNGDAKSPKMYFCKHCDYRNVDIASLTSHYQDDHPYIRCNAVYIHDSNDQSATFRCLECPVEFLNMIDLKRHYMKNHPKAPDVFTMKSHELSLIFKCFVCQFTTNILKSLKNHYKENHATLEVDNSLLFCRYSVNGSQEELSHLNQCGHTPTPERSEAVSPRSAPCKDAETEASPQQSTSSGEDVSLYKCSHCKFSHKSAVVMQVHYQKYHPDNAITIDKIKQSAQMTPEKSPNSLSAKASTPQSSSDHSKEAKDKAELPQKKTLLTVESVEDRGKTKKLLNKRKRESSPSGDSPPSKTFYCKFCSYTCEKRRSLIGHHYGKHPLHKHMDSQEILKYSAEVQKKKHQSDTEKRTSSPRSKTKKQEPETNVSLAGASVKGHKNIYLHAEKLFYCQKCNYGNPSIFGVMTHQAKTHQGINTSGKHVSAYSAVIREEIKKSKLNAKDSSFSTLLPLPLMNKGDENMFFCHFCNYRKGSVSQVIKHYNRRHREFAAHPSQIQQYTSMVLKETEKLHQKTPRNQQVNQESPERGENINEKIMKKLSTPPLVPASSSAPLTQRSLQCFRCTFSTQYVYMLKKHLREIHHVRMTVTQVLRMCFRKGMLQSGYHCELCVFSDDKAEEVYMHYRKCHRRRKSSLEFVNTRLYVGPETSSPEEKIPKQRCVDGGLPSAKEDSMELNKKKAGGDAQAEGQNKIHELFDSYQVPLEFDKSFDDATVSPKLFKCHHCSASFNSRRGLTIHCGIKHTDIPMEKNSEEKQQVVPAQTRVHVFKCLHCTYVNTSYHGVITHCKMKHPSLPFRADSLHVDLMRIQHCSDKRIGPDETLKLSGHMCETCSQIFATLEKLNKHCEKEHNETEADSVVKTFRPAAGSKRQLSILKASFLNKKIYSQIKCQHCSYKCSTKIALIRHVRVHHMNIVTKDSDYRCVLCSKPYYKKQRLSTHYNMKHGSDAYLKYFVPIYGQVPKSPNWLSTQQPPNNNNNATAKETKILVYQCPSCPYMNASYHGTLTHCQMKHPTVTARADELQTCEILSTNMVNCDLGKNSNARGYMCRKCPQIYASLKNLKIHCLKNHDAPDASEIAVEIEKVQSSKESVSQASLFNNQTSEISHSHRSDSPEICQSNSPTGQKNMLYRCQICDYKGFYRRYLQSHYKKAHKLDVQTISKLLQKYDKRNKARVQPGPQSEEAASVTCKKCPNLTFKSSELLSEHYSAAHCILDFTVLSLGFKHKSTGAYKCVHCDMQLNGTRKLAFHLDRHRERKTLTAGAAKTTAPSEDKSLTFSQQEDVPTLETMDELTKWNETPVQTFSVPTSPPLSPSRGTNMKQAKPESGYTCKRCRRTFMSLKGLRTHERSHATMAAIKKIDKVPISNLKEKVSKFVLYKPGTLRPFMCSFCSYRTPVMGLWWSHFMRKHRDECPELNVDQAEPDDEESTEPADTGMKHPPKVEDEPDEVKESTYLEPPDVQRQLNHYNLMAQTKSKTVVQESKFAENRLYHCELCNFCSGHLSSIRRHYLNSHGKKMLRCKDCSFVTGLRKNLEMHMASGHSTCQSKPTHDKDLRCPFCLYQTKNKNNMIDHIVLHREERVVPIEVRRPKLSRYLQGIVFRCQKCTFSSSTADNLRLHMTKHDDVNPYKCRLCYFDCTRLSDLEAHLSDKHQVVRNHELVGQVSLDQLEASVGRRRGEEQEEEPLSNLEQDNGDSEDKQTGGSDFTNIPAETDMHQKQEEDRQREKPASVSDTQCEDATLNTTVQMKQDPQKQAVIFGLQDTTTGQGMGNEGESSALDCSDAEKERQSNESQEDNTQVDKTHSNAPEQRTLDVNAREQDNIMCRTPLPDEDSSASDMHREAEEQRTVKMELDTESNDEQSHHMSVDEDKINTHVTTLNLAQKSVTHERNSVSVSPNSAHEESLAVSIAKCKEELVQEDEIMESYGEMPVLENEYLKEELVALGCCKEEEEEEEVYYSERKQDREIEIKEEDEERQCSDEQHVSPDVCKATEAAAGDLRSSHTQEKLYTCELCGRNLTNSSELERHVMRHGI